ncbi:MAG: peptidylprolyl isomerase [Bryobacteraceae bacterium]
MRLSSFLACFLMVAGSCLAAEILVVDEIIAKVNGEIITRNDIVRTRAQMEASYRQQGLTGTRLVDALTEGEKNILREKLDQLLLLSKAKEMSINVDTDINKQLAEIQRRVNIADPDKFQEFVRQETGNTFEDYKNELKNQAMTNRVVRQEVASKINFKREELQKYYDEHQKDFERQDRVFLREILVGSEKDAAAAEKKAKDLSARGKRGEKFEELAQQNSDSPSAPQGGEIGAFEKGNLRGEIENAVWNQPKGYVTDPINVGNGFLILKVEDHQKAGLASFEEVQNEVQGRLFGPRMQPELRKYLTQLRMDAFLEIKNGFEDSGAAPGKVTTWADPAEIKPETVTKEQVAAKTRNRRLLFIPIPGTSVQNTGTSSSR